MCTHFADTIALDGTIYLRADPEVCHQRLGKRSRPGVSGTFERAEIFVRHFK